MVADVLSQSLPLLLLTIGLLLSIAEAFIPGAHFFVVGAALLGAGLVGVLFPPAANVFALGGMTVLFAALTLYIYRNYALNHSEADTTSDSDSLRGQVGYATEQITPMEGEVKLEDGGFDPFYQARTMNGTIDEGEEVIVLDPGGGNVVTVESLETAGVGETKEELLEFE